MPLLCVERSGHESIMKIGTGMKVALKPQGVIAHNFSHYFRLHTSHTLLNLLQNRLHFISIPTRGSKTESKGNEIVPLELRKLLQMVTWTFVHSFLACI